MPLTPSTRLGAYEIVAPLGAGGMGEVYRAKDLRLGREIALKVLPAELSGDASRLARFEREARTVAALNHPNIVVLHSIEDDGNLRFLTMELVEGQSLNHLVTPGGLELPRVIELGIALADALAAAHEKGVVHRDLKPANVMLTRDGRLKVLDFGLASFARTDSGLDLSKAATMATPLSEAGMIVGTVPYMAPEQLRGEPADARTDLFALGIVLYELAGGVRPFRGETQADVSSAILRDTPEPLGALRPDLPQALVQLIGLCLEKQPRDRVQTALDVSNALRRLRRDLERGESTPAARPAPRDVASIAVLPFVNRSASEEDEYFSDGLADELLNALAKIKQLRVTARSSSFQFKGRKDDIPTIARKLNVTTLLEGSVRKAGNRIRVSVQLVDVRDSSHMWSESYERTLDDVFAVQDDIAGSVVRELRTTLLGEEPDSGTSGEARADVFAAFKGRGSDPEAHRLYLQGHYLCLRMTPEDLAAAVTYLRQALDRDSGFARCWAELGFAYALQGGMGWESAEECFRRGREAVERALSLEPDLAEGHAHLGIIQTARDWDWRGAEASFARARELAPGNAAALNWSGRLAWAQGRLDQATALCREALAYDPLSAGANHQMGMVLHSAGRLEEAEAAFRTALELIPQRVATRAYLSIVLLRLGRGVEALEEASREPDAALILYARSILFHALGRAGDSDEAVRRLGDEHGETYAFQVGEAHAARGEADAAFEWFDRARANRDTGIVELVPSPHVGALRDDPRWAALLARLGHEAAGAARAGEMP